MENKLVQDRLQCLHLYFLVVPLDSFNSCWWNSLKLPFSLNSARNAVDLIDWQMEDTACWVVIHHCILVILNSCMLCLQL